MKQIFYGQLDLTKLGQIARSHSELIKEVQFKDGMHKLININVFGKDEPDKFGNTAAIKASCKKANEKQGLNYFVGDLKPSEQNTQQAQQKVTHRDDPINPKGDLPF